MVIILHFHHRKKIKNIELEDFIDAINYKLNTNPSEKEVKHLKNRFMKKSINGKIENNVDTKNKIIYIYITTRK